MDLGALAESLGSFPFGYETYLPQPDCRASLVGIRSLIGFGRRRSPLALSVLYPQQRYTTRYLNIFRGEPAIPEFD